MQWNMQIPKITQTKQTHLSFVTSPTKDKEPFHLGSATPLFGCQVVFVVPQHFDLTLRNDLIRQCSAIELDISLVDQAKQLVVFDVFCWDRRSLNLIGVKDRTAPGVGTTSRKHQTGSICQSSS